MVSMDRVSFSAKNTLNFSENVKHGCALMWCYTMPDCEINEQMAAK